MCNYTSSLTNVQYSYPKTEGDPFAPRITPKVNPAPLAGPSLPSGLCTLQGTASISPTL
jgi:hypothetical protein